MAVMFAMGQGKVAAENIVNSFSGEPLRKYKAVDLGYLIPFTTRKAPGVIMGIKVSGIIGYFMHYFMCFYRSTWRNKLKILKHWIFALFA
jgi:NADH dehydrogenase FAD-containing subunit